MNIFDIETVVKYELEIFNSTLGFNFIYNELNHNPYAYYFVMVENNKLIGYIGSWINGKFGQIVNFFIVKHERNKGNGKILINHCIDNLKSIGATIISLEVRVSNIRAIKFYESLNFTKAYVKKGYYQDNEDAFVMILYL